MTSISCREHDDVRITSPNRYKNYTSQVVDGVAQLVETEPVAPSVADEFSVTMNAITRKPSDRMRSRLNVDAVDLADTVKILTPKSK